MFGVSLFFICAVCFVFHLVLLLLCVRSFVWSSLSGDFILYYTLSQINRLPEKSVARKCDVYLRKVNQHILKDFENASFYIGYHLLKTKVERMYKINI